MSDSPSDVLSSNSSGATPQSANLPQAGAYNNKRRRIMIDTPLQRGSACLSCRKRKMKCDAGKPACAQCLKSRRAHECDYGKPKTRTQMFQERIKQLENRLRELEGSSTSHYPDVKVVISPPVFASPSPVGSSRNFHSNLASDAMVGAGGSSSSSSSLERPGLPTNGLPTPDSSDSSEWMGDQHGSELPGNNLISVSAQEELLWNVNTSIAPEDDPSDVTEHWWEAEMPSPRMSQLLVDIFLSHRHQYSFEIDVNRFQASLNSDAPPHPALLNVIYAHACYVSPSPDLSPHWPCFVSRALKSISAALETSDRLVQVIQASCLLAILFYVQGRFLEGYYHTGAAAQLAVGLGLHQISLQQQWAKTGPELSSAAASSSSSDQHIAAGGSSTLLPPPVDDIELRERILAFWQVFNLDRCWAVATGFPVALTEGKHSRTRFKTPWPRGLEEEYQVKPVLPESQSSSGSRDSIYTSRVKATMIFERAWQLSSTFNDSSSQISDQFWVEFQTIDGKISHLSHSLPPIRLFSGDQQRHDSAHHEPKPRVDTFVFVIHALLHAAAIQLHSPFASRNVTSRKKSAAVADIAAAMVHDLDDADYAFLDPIMATCWTTIAEALLHEITLRSTSATHMDQELATLHRQLNTIILAMTRLGVTVPLAAYQATKLQHSRAISY